MANTPSEHPDKAKVLPALKAGEVYASLFRADPRLRLEDKHKVEKAIAQIVEIRNTIKAMDYLDALYQTN